MFGLWVNGHLLGVFRTQGLAEAVMCDIGESTMRKVGYVPDYSVRPVTAEQMRACWEDK